MHTQHTLLFLLFLLFLLWRGYPSPVPPHNALLPVNPEDTPPSTPPFMHYLYLVQVAAIDQEWSTGTALVKAESGVMLEEGETYVDGIRIPKSLDGPTAVAFVISQKKGARGRG